MDNHLRVMYNETAAKLKDVIGDLESCAITHDAWTLIATDSYGTITLHFINSDWNLRNVVLQTRKVVGQHTADAIRDQLANAKLEWGFPRPIGVTDNASNKLKAFKLLEWLQISCMGHNINLAVKSALSVPEVSKLVGKGRTVV